MNENINFTATWGPGRITPLGPAPQLLPEKTIIAGCWPRKTQNFQVGVDSGEQVHVGDINSDAIGSGARYNSGKPDYSLMMLRDMPVPAETDAYLLNVYDHLAEFQDTGNSVNLEIAIDQMYEYARENADTKYVFENVVRVWEFGKQKYKAWNWAKGMPWSVPIGCAVRHFLAIAEAGEELDEDSGLPHWAHLVCNLQMLLLYTRTYPQGDDLPFHTWQQEEESISKTTITFPVTGATFNGTLLDTTPTWQFEFQNDDPVNQY